MQSCLQLTCMQHVLSITFSIVGPQPLWLSAEQYHLSKREVLQSQVSPSGKQSGRGRKFVFSKYLIPPSY